MVFFAPRSRFFAALLAQLALPTFLLSALEFLYSTTRTSTAPFFPLPFSYSQHVSEPLDVLFPFCLSICVSALTFA